MLVKFDSLNRYETPNFIICNPGSVFKDGRLSRVVGAATHTSEEEIILNFNAISTLNFRSTKVSDDSSVEGRYAIKMYRYLQNRRLIFVEGIGYFVITGVEEVCEDGMSYKDVSASSCEIEIQKKALTYIENGTYLFIDLLEKVVATIPKWTIGFVDSNIAKKYRTFEDVDVSLNTLAFLMQDVQEAYECIFVFDPMHRTICVYDQNNYVIKTDIHLTQNDLINELNVSEDVDELYTALSVFGENDLTISAINPLGTTTIYNFDYYLGWMSESLRERVKVWRDKVESYIDPYYDLNVKYYDTFIKHSDCYAEIEKQQVQIDMYLQCRDNIVAESTTDKIGEYNSIIVANGGSEISILDSIDEILAEIDALVAQVRSEQQQKNDELSVMKVELENCQSQMAQIHNEVSFQEYFTQEEYDELYDYIFEGTYTDEYVTTTDSMTMTEKLVQMQELYNRAKRSLSVASSPAQEFSVDTEDFIFVKSFLRWSQQLEVGCLINVELDDGGIAELFLTAIQLNWDDKSLVLTFGNRLNRSDPQSLFHNVLGDVQKSSNSISYIKDILYPVKNGQLSDLEESVQNLHTLTLDTALVSQNGEVLINSTGYTGRKKLSDGGFSTDQLKVTANTIVFSEDAWNTCMTVLGYVSLDSFVTAYGVNAQSIIGKLILSDRLKIYDNKGVELFDIIDGKVKDSVSEWSKEFNTKLELTNKSISGLTIRLDDVVISVDELQAKIKSISDTLDEHTAKINVLQDSFEASKSTIEELQQNIKQLDADLDVLVDKIGNIPDDVTISEMITDIDSDNITIKADIETVKAELKEIKEKIESL